MFIRDILSCLNAFAKLRMQKLLRDAWRLAIKTLSWIELQRLGERLALTKAAEQLKIKDRRTMGFAHKLIFETLRRQNTIDSILNTVLEPRSLADLKLDQKSFLRLFTYVAKFEKIGMEKAAVIARTGRAVLGWRLLNQVEEFLGLILSIEIRDLLKKVDDEERVALRTYNPKWFVKYCFRMLGRSEAIKLLESTAQTLPVYLRVNTLKDSEDDIIRKIEREGAILEKVSSLKYTFRLLKCKIPLVRMKSFKTGLFYIQDKASCLAVEIADPRVGTKVLDVCGAPGAKTTLMAQLMQNKGIIYSLDYSGRRMNVWKLEVKRMGVQIAVPIVSDACSSLPITLKADLVFLDPPCTSTGAFSKIPSAKWRLNNRSVSNMAAIQWKMLNNCAGYVREGGTLVYSTCSVTLEENEMQIEKFLKWHLDFALTETSPRIGLPAFRGQDRSQRFYPHIHECTGFFIAKLSKKPS
jgi:16S rRNA (cytosine967-C5)-methyltransferase